MVSGPAAQQTDQNGLMKWERAVHHLGSLARACAETLNQPMFSVRVTQLWAVGDILAPQRDVDAVTVALAINRPAKEVAWLTEPSGTQHWANAVRLNKNPFIVFWRSDQAAIWNHESSGLPSCGTRLRASGPTFWRPYATAMPSGSEVLGRPRMSWPRASPTNSR